MSEREPGRAPSFGRDSGTNTARAVGLIVVAVLVSVLLLHHSNTTAAITTPTTRPPVTTTPATTVPSSTTSTTATTLVPLSQVKVQVLNAASPTKPFAGEFTLKLKGEGYATVTPNNATSDVTTSAIYVFVPSFLARANALASSLGLPATAVKTTITAGAPIPASTKALTPDLVLVVGTDLESKA